MSTSQELVRELIGRGMSRRAIGQAIGRNDRLIGFAESGAKPLGDLVPALSELRARLEAGEAPAAARRPVSAPVPPRTTQAGKVARVRKPRTITGRSGQWSTTTMRHQAARAGSKGAVHPLEAAAKAGHKVAVTVSTNRRASVNSTSGSRAHGHGVEMELGPAAAVLAAVNGQYGGDFTAYAMARLTSAGHLTVTGDPSAAVESIELRSYP